MAGIYDIIMSGSGIFKTETFAKFIQIAGMADYFKRQVNPITILAPEDSAFQVFPEFIFKRMIDRMVANPKPLQSLILYHVLNGKLTREALAKIAREGGTVKNYFSREIKVTSQQLGLHLLTSPDYDIVKFDEKSRLVGKIEADNGIVYYVNRVLSPNFCPPDEILHRYQPS